MDPRFGHAGTGSEYRSLKLGRQAERRQSFGVTGTRVVCFSGHLCSVFWVSDRFWGSVSPGCSLFEGPEVFLQVFECRRVGVIGFVLGSEDMGAEVVKFALH